MRILPSGSDSLTARHVPWVYWAGVALLLVGVVKEAPLGLIGGLSEWWDSLFLAAGALLLLLLWGAVVQVDIDRRRRRVLIKRWGVMGLRVRAFPVDRVTAIYTERHAREGKLTMYRMVLMDPAQKLVALTPYSVMELGMNRTAGQMHEYLQESRFQPVTASSSRPEAR